MPPTSACVAAKPGVNYASVSLEADAATRQRLGSLLFSVSARACGGVNHRRRAAHQSSRSGSQPASPRVHRGGEARLARCHAVALDCSRSLERTSPCRCQAAGRRRRSALRRRSRRSRTLPMTGLAASTTLGIDSPDADELRRDLRSPAAPRQAPQARGIQGPPGLTPGPSTISSAIDLLTSTKRLPSACWYVPTRRTITRPGQGRARPPRIWSEASASCSTSKPTNLSQCVAAETSTSGLRMLSGKSNRRRLEVGGWRLEVGGDQGVGDWGRGWRGRAFRV